MTACTYLSARPSRQRVFDAKLERMQGTLDTVVANFSSRLAQLQTKVDSSADKARTRSAVRTRTRNPHLRTRPCYPPRGRAAGLETY